MGATKLLLRPLRGYDDDRTEQQHAGSVEARTTTDPFLRHHDGGGKCATRSKITIRLPKTEQQ